MKRFMPFCLLIMLTLVSGQSGAAQAGQLLFARGTVSIVDENRFSRGASTGSEFAEGETVVTGARSIAQLRLSDGALLALRSNSEYQIEKQVFDEAGDVYEQAGRLLAGWMRSVTGAIGARRPQKVSQSTSVATIGVRGTAYQVIHVPEQGLAGFPGLAPGSYIYLEDGALEVTAESGSWAMRPGDVLEVLGSGTGPRLAPKLRQLFLQRVERETNLEERRERIANNLAADNVDDRRNSEQINAAVEDAVNNTLPTVFPDFSGDVGGVAALADIVGATESSAMQVQFTGAGSNKFATAMGATVAGGGNIALQGEIEFYRPTNTGARLIRAADGTIASQVHWGVWQDNRFLGTNDVGTGPAPLLSPGNWHYMIADNVLTNDAFSRISAIGAVGTVRYSYTGGTPFLNTTNAAANTALFMEAGSYVDVDLSQFLLDANVVFNNGLNLQGSGSFTALFTGDMLIDNSDGGLQPPTAFGTMAGAFVGQDLEGLITGIDIVDANTSEQFSGTALFEKPRANLAVQSPVVGP